MDSERANTLSVLDEVNLNLVENLDDFLAMKRWLGERRSILAVDVETSGFQWQDRDVTRLVQFGDTENGWAVPAQDWVGAIREVLDDYEGPITGHNTRFDLHFLEKLVGYKPKWSNVHDTMIMAALLDPPGRKGLKILAAKHIDPRAQQGEIELHAAFRKGGWDWATVPIQLPEYWCYGVLDTVLTARLWNQFEPLIHNAGLDDAYELESNAARCLYAMEKHGFAVDLDYVNELEGRLVPFLDEAQDWVHQHYRISATSNKQLARALQDLGAPLTKLTDAGNIAVDEEVLTGLSDKYPLAEVALQIRQAAKIVNSYLTNFRKFATPDGMVHARIRQMQARTHRMSITDPALQTLGRGSLVRDSFRARPGNKLISCDFEQVEARLFADYANVEGMIDIIMSGGDLHSFTARTSLGRDPTKAERQVYKTTTFTLLYGGGVKKVAYSCGITVEEAQHFVSAYHEAFPSVKRWMKGVEAEGREREAREGIGYIRTTDGSILPIDEGSDKFYVLTNYTIQGEAAVLFKRRLVSAANAGLLDYMVLPVHDELIIEVPDEDADEARLVLQDAMTDLTSYKVPISASASAPVDRWGSAK